jgi:hypothetical protein
MPQAGQSTYNEQAGLARIQAAARRRAAALNQPQAAGVEPTVKPKVCMAQASLWHAGDDRWPASTRRFGSFAKSWSRGSGDHRGGFYRPAREYLLQDNARTFVPDPVPEQPDEDTAAQRQAATCEDIHPGLCRTRDSRHLPLALYLCVNLHNALGKDARGTFLCCRLFAKVG